MKNKVILLVEDNENDVLLTTRAFKKNNILNKVVVAGNGVEALDYLFYTGKFAEREDRALPQIILLDLNMPKMDGLEVLRRIRTDERTKLQPVVVLTTSNQDRDRIESYQLGVNSYVRKPVEFTQFMAAIQQLGLYWLILNEAP